MQNYNWNLQLSLLGLAGSHAVFQVSDFVKELFSFLFESTDALFLKHQSCLGTRQASVDIPFAYQSRNQDFHTTVKDLIVVLYSEYQLSPKIMVKVSETRPQV